MDNLDLLQAAKGIYKRECEQLQPITRDKTKVGRGCA